MTDNAKHAVAEARRWIGTPYVHQASVCGGGTDCLGLIRGVWRSIHGQEPCAIPAYSASWGETGTAELLFQAGSDWLVERSLDQETCGDVLLFRMRSGAIAKHLGIQTATGRLAAFVHAYSGHGVVESPLSAPWRNRIVARFAFP